jgi:uncharacterized damage-inducible protein DinB
MKLSEVLLPEFDLEMANTKKSLERVPWDRSEWKPHEKSMALGYLARHIATLPEWATLMVEKDNYDVAPANGDRYQVPEANSTAEVLALLEQYAAAARNAIAEASDEHFQKPWSLLATGKVVFTQPRFAAVRSIINHMIHHRAQLGVYLRLNDIPVPSIYGPSADEGAWVD